MPACCPEGPGMGPSPKDTGSDRNPTAAPASPSGQPGPVDMHHVTGTKTPGVSTTRRPSNDYPESTVTLGPAATHLVNSAPGFRHVLPPAAQAGNTLRGACRPGHCVKKKQPRSHPLHPQLMTRPGFHPMMHLRKQDLSLPDGSWGTGLFPILSADREEGVGRGGELCWGSGPLGLARGPVS